MEHSHAAMHFVLAFIQCGQFDMRDSEWLQLHVDTQLRDDEPLRAGRILLPIDAQDRRTSRLHRHSNGVVSGSDDKRALGDGLPRRGHSGGRASSDSTTTRRP